VNHKLKSNLIFYKKGITEEQVEKIESHTSVIEYVMSEIFPTKIRERAVCIATLSLWLTDVMLNQFFRTVRDSFGIGVNFLLFAVFLLIHLFVV
jgi:hypothetical protein